jgi:polyphosphate kinase 2 (PPK2 family)
MNKEFRALAKPYLVTDGKGFKLKDHNPRGPGTSAAHQRTKKYLKKGVEALSELQETLYAQDRWGILLIFQAMDAAGKDSAIKHVLSGVDPKGCQVDSFKAPSSEELDHDFLWRTSKVAAGARAHRHLQPLVLRGSADRAGAPDHPRLPEAAARGRLAADLEGALRGHQRVRALSGAKRVPHPKFFLNISRAEQRRRLLARLDRPEKNWKFEIGDLAERGRWRQYMGAYEDMIRKTATPHAPWLIIPGDDKKFARTVIAAAVVDALSGLHLKFPELNDKQKA